MNNVENHVLIHNGTVVTPEAVERADVLIEGETIAAVGPALSVPARARIVDADGRLVFPGLIDPHVHLREPGGEHKEDFGSGTRAALAGGFTTVLAMPNTQPPITDQETLARTLTLATSKAVCDFGLFVGATADNTTEVARLRDAVGLKLYMGSSTGSLLVADLAGQIAHFERYPGVIAIHAEDEETVAHFAEQDTTQGQRRPPLCAVLAVARALVLAGHFQRRLHICHVTTEAELALIRDAKERDVPVTCEVTPHHLFLTTADKNRLGPLGRMNPPLRSREDVEALWANLDVVDSLATDHAPHTLEEKHSPTPPAGVPGLETALPLLLTAVHAGKLSLHEIARLTSAGPAAVYGLPQKGHIAPGYDADLTLVNPDAEWIIGERPLFTRCGWSPFEGDKVKGRVERVFLRGQEVYAHDQVLAQPGYGQAI
ncbi:MAG: dihydroorotase family protein [Chloroflexota bacterium]|nr:dihydroorotase family protein [Chloroflexota bacterium]